MMFGVVCGNPIFHDSRNVKFASLLQPLTRQRSSGSKTDNATKQNPILSVSKPRYVYLES